jgi:hypothetical protein
MHSNNRGLEMSRMRVLLAIALMIFGFAGVSAVRAADLAVGPAGIHSPVAFGYGERAGMLVIYDDEPGVLVRAYWSAPWHNHHYFPSTGRKPKLGRDENLNARGASYRPAKNFKRQWSNEAPLRHVLEAEQPIYLMPPDPQSAPRAEMPPQNPKP